jgi:hypothetical protein
MDEETLRLIGPERAADLKLFDQWLDERTAAGDVKAVWAEFVRRVEMLRDDTTGWSRAAWRELGI